MTSETESGREEPGTSLVLETPTLWNLILMLFVMANFVVCLFLCYRMWLLDKWMIVYAVSTTRAGEIGPSAWDDSSAVENLTNGLDFSIRAHVRSKPKEKEVAK